MAYSTLLIYFSSVSPLLTFLSIMQHVRTAQLIACVPVLSAGLFHRAIIMSGSVTSPWSGAPHPANSSRGIARSLGCLAATSRSILTCLRTKSTSEILRAFETQYKVWGPWRDAGCKPHLRSSNSNNSICKLR
jgi:hypothetical protein